MNKVTIIDYGLGNLYSIRRAIEHLGGQVDISDQPSVISSAKKLILPGVGAFGEGMSNLAKRGLIEPIKEHMACGKMLLGICLGMQLMMDESEEFGIHKGLGIIRGKVKRLSLYAGTEHYKIPHVGWSSISHPVSTENRWAAAILKDVPSGSFFYFVHSFAAIPDDVTATAAVTEYGGRSFSSVIVKKNFFGCQFHPEKSADAGLAVLKNFLTL